ncbi:MAG: hypothetical protein HQ517_06040 [SAR324 cluster bacterium]|nr:hypothetical protein [SAR324 cluster bacterium]
MPLRRQQHEKIKNRLTEILNELEISYVIVSHQYEFLIANTDTIFGMKNGILRHHGIHPICTVIIIASWLESFPTNTQTPGWLVNGTFPKFLPGSLSIDVKVPCWQYMVTEMF